MNFVSGITARRSRPAYRPTLGFLLFGLMAASLFATQVPRMNLEEVVDASESIVHGTVVRTWSAWDDGHRYIWTHYEIQVADRLKGGAPGLLVISEPGGTVGEAVLQVVGTPQYEVGEEVVLFAVRTPLGYLRTCGWGQGKFRVVRAARGGEVTVRSATGGAQMVERPGAASVSKGTALSEINGQELEQFKTRVRQLVAQPRDEAAR